MIPLTENNIAVLAVVPKLLSNAFELQANGRKRYQWHLEANDNVCKLDFNGLMKLFQMDHIHGLEELSGGLDYADTIPVSDKSKEDVIEVGDVVMYADGMISIVKLIENSLYILENGTHTVAMFITLICKKKDRKDL